MAVGQTRAPGIAVEALEQFPSLPGRQLMQRLPAFTQAQPLHRPDLLHLQQTMDSILLVFPSYSARVFAKMLQKMLTN